MVSHSYNNNNTNSQPRKKSTTTTTTTTITRRRTSIILRRKMVKGKRRTNRNSKDENAVFNHADGPKGPKDSRLETRLVNGSAHLDTKITSYFSPSRSPPIADDAETESVTVLEEECGKDPELSNAQLSRNLPGSSPSAPGSIMNGHSPSKASANESPQRTVCTRSQTVKDQLLQSCTADLTNGVEDCDAAAGDDDGDSLSLQESVDAQDLPAEVATPATPTSPASPVGDDGSSSHTGPPTPHKIQALNEEKLRLDSPLSPSSALSKLKLTLTPKKLKFNEETTKARRKLPTANTSRGTSQVKTQKLPKVNNTTQVSNGEAKPAQRNSQMTQFYPIRRSERKPKTTLLQERQKEIEDRIRRGKEEGLKVKHFGVKGRGVVTTRKFKKGEFVVEYIGDLIDVREAKERESIYAQDATKGCYNYYFTFQNQQYCIDATAETKYLGRLVNHSRNGNLVTKAVEVNGTPHLILLAKQDLEPGTEILYDYGDRSKEALEHHPWLAS